MVDVARVNLYGQPIGSVRWDQRYEVAQFEHDPDFVRQGIEPSPLMMPVREGRVYSFGELDKTTFKGLPGMLADSLPDTYDRALFEKWLALTGRTSGNAIETLCFLVKRCMGALEFEPAIDAVDTDIRIEVDSLVDSQRSPCRQIKFQREHQLRQKGCHCRNSAPRHLCRRATGQGNHCLQQSHRRDPFGTGRGSRRVRLLHHQAGRGIRHCRIQGDGELRASGILLLTSCEGMRHRHGGMLADRREREGPFPDKEVRPNKRCKGARADTLRYRALRLPAPQGLLLRTGVRLDARAAAHLQGGAGDVPQNGVQCRGAQPGRPHEEHLVPDGQRREMAPFSGL